MNKPLMEENDRLHKENYEPIVNVEETVNVEPSVNVEENVESGQDDDFFRNHLDLIGRVNDVDVDMSGFKEHFEREDKWLIKSVESGVGDLEVNDEVIGIDFDQYDSGDEGSDLDGQIRRKKLRKLKANMVDGSQVNSPFYVGKPFYSPKHVKDLVKSHAVETRRLLKIVKNDKKRIRVRCEGHIPKLKNQKGIGESFKKKGEGPSKGKEVISAHATCPWTLYVSKTDQDESWLVKTFNATHKCLQTREMRWASSTFLSQHIHETISSTPEISGKGLQELLQKKFQLGIDKQVAYRAKDKAMKKLRGNYVEQYALLRDYVLELQSRNPDTTVKIDVEVEPNPASETRVFKRIYICLGPLKRGFKAAGRELLGLDGAFIKGPYPGQLLTAVSVDANNGIYPIAYAIVEAETKCSWIWFLNCLGEDMDLTRESNFTFISDRQKGLMPAIASVYPNAEHRFW